MKKNVYLNGKIIPAETATIGVGDAGLLHGASAFTTMLAHNGVVFRLDRHLARLMETMATFGMRTDATAGSLASAVDELLAANELTEARVRVTLTPGDVHLQVPTTLITAEALAEYPEQWYSKGIPVVISSFKQPTVEPTCGYKTGSYFTRVLARREAAAKGAEEALWFTPQNILAEACFCNVFLVLDGKVHTPPLSTPILGGIVRQAVIELCSRELSLECETEKQLTIRETLAAEEIFITASCSGIRPVVRVEGHAVGEEKPGKITVKIMEAYKKLLDREC